MVQKILVVDDDLFIREIYVEILKTAGFEIDSAIDGEEGLKKLQTGGYALTLLDLNMPKLNGLGVLDGIYKNPPMTPNGPIILLTNGAVDSELKDALQKGATSYLVKSDLNPDQLLAAIKKLLNTE